MRSNLDKLTHKILRACNGQPREVVVNAMLDACVWVLQTIDEDKGRNQIIRTFIAIFLALVERDVVHDENLERIRIAIATLPDADARDVAILQHVKTLVLASSVGMLARPDKAP